MRDGDWAAYGRYLEELGRYLQQLVPGGSSTAMPVDDSILQEQTGEQSEAAPEGETTGE